MAHDHAHHHHHAHREPSRHGRAFAIGIGLNLIYVAAEAGYGFATGSLALLADAGHNLSDVLGLLLAWVAAVLSARRPSRTFTYGLGRSSILAALGNALLLLVATGAIVAEAVERLGDPQPVPGGVVMAVAGVGILINGATAMLFAAGRHGDINIRGAWLHMIADALVSVGVVAAGFAMQLTGWTWLDPVTSLIVAAVIIFGTWGLFRESLRLSMDAVPAGIDREGVEAWLRALPGVSAIHDVHIWPISTTAVALTAHVVRPQAGLDDEFLHDATHGLEEKFGIAHATIQVERAVIAHGCEG
jgi:cobalt-zinc-cadmium efflux system protein